MYVFIGLHRLLPEATTRVEVFCKKGALKNFANFVGKHLCWSLLLIRLQAWHLFWRISANNCFCTTITPLSIRFTLYSAPSSSSLLLLLISPMFVLVQIPKASKNLNLVSHFHWSHFLCCYFFPCFFWVSQFCFIFSCCCS